jgi:acyl carrier protein
MIMFNRELISKLVFESIESFQNEVEYNIDLSTGENTRLFGGNSQLDSISLVTLIVIIEEKIETEFGISILLADEKAMSRRTSPFSKIDNLIEYIFDLLNDQNNLNTN